MRVCVRGLGYIGLPTAVLWPAEVPFRVGLDELIAEHASAGAAR